MAAPHTQYEVLTIEEIAKGEKWLLQTYKTVL
jgi:hypothetical protein